MTDIYIYIYIYIITGVQIPGKPIFPFPCDGNLPGSLRDCLIVEIKPYFMCPAAQIMYLGKSSNFHHLEILRARAG